MSLLLADSLDGGTKTPLDFVDAAVVEHDWSVIEGTPEEKRSTVTGRSEVRVVRQPQPSPRNLTLE